MKLQKNIVLSVFILIVPLSVFGSDDSGNQNDMARAEWVKGFQKLEEAEYSEEFGNYQKALDLLNEAKKTFERVKNLYKQWNQSLLNFRIRYCEQKIKKLESLNTLGAVNTNNPKAKEPLQSSHLENQNRKLQERNQELENDISSLANKLTILSKERNQDKSSHLDAESLSAIESELEEVKGLNQRLQDSNQSLENQIADLSDRVQQLTQEQENVDVELGKSTEQVEQLKEELAEKAEKLTRLRDELVNQKKNVDDLEQRNQAGVQAGRNQVDELRSELESAKETNQKLAQQLENLEKVDQENTRLQEVNDQLEIQITDLNNQFEQFRSEHKSAKTELGKKDERFEQLSAELGLKSEKLEQANNELVTLKDQLEELTEQNRQAGEEYENQLKELRSNIETAQEDSQRLTGQLSNLQKVDTENKHLQKVKQDLELKISDLSSKIENLTSEQQSADTVFTKRDEQIEKLKAELAEKTTRVEELNKQLLDRKEQLDNFENKNQNGVQEYNEQVDAIRAELKLAQETNQQLTQQMEMIIGELEAQSTQEEVIQTQKQTQFAEVIKIQKLLEAQREKKEGYRDRLDDLESELKEIRGAKLKLETDLERLHTNYAEKDRELRDAEKELQEYNEEAKKWDASLKAETTKSHGINKAS